MPFFLAALESPLLMAAAAFECDDVFKPALVVDDEDEPPPIPTPTAALFRPMTNPEGIDEAGPEEAPPLAKMIELFPLLPE